MKRQKSREESMRGIKDAAVRLFASRGYANTSLEDVATAAGFTKGAVYYYFKSKEKLLLNVMQDIEARSIDKTVASVNRLDGTVLEKMLEFSTLHGRWAAESPDDLAILMLASIETAKAKAKNGIRKRVLTFYSKMEDLLTQVIEQAKACGELPTGFATVETVMTTIAHHDGNMLLWYRSGCDPKVGRILTASSRHALEELFGQATRSADTRHESRQDDDCDETVVARQDRAAV